MIRRWISTALALVCLAGAPALAIGPPIRSTRYDGSNQAFASFPHKAAYDSSVSMTIEAWIYRENAGRCETIAGHHYQDSWWFGLCPTLRFYRSGGTQASSSVTIKAWQWTHVAVTYDGTNARFYVNGALTDTILLANAGGGRSYPLVIGADSTGGGYWFPFQGNIDELRIWSTVRTQAQISDNRFKELRSGPGLVAAFGTGGKTENLASVTGTLGSGASEKVLGILPRDLVVPKAAIAPFVNGQIDENGEYAGAERMVIPYHAETNDGDAVAWLVYKDTPPEGLYIAVSPPRHNVNGWPYDSANFGLLIDPTFSRHANPQASDVWFYTYLNALNYGVNEVSYWQNGNGSWYGQCMNNGQPCTAPSLYGVGKAWCSGDEFNVLPPCIEFRIDKSLLGEWTEFDGLAMMHRGWAPGNVFSMAPEDADPVKPDTWVRVSYGDSAVTLPKAKISGKIHAGTLASSPGLPNWRVTLLAGATGYETFTDANGNFSFDVAVPEGQEIQIQADNCGFCKYRTPTFSGAGIPPSVVSDLVVKYPGCTNATCQYQNVDFYIAQTPGPVSLTGVSKEHPVPKITVRDNPTVVSANTADTVVLTGANFHDFLNVYISPVAPTVVCPCPDDWVLFKCDVVTRAADGSSITVRMPTLPGRVPLRQGQQGGNPFGSGYRWVVEDTWTRPNMVTYNLWPHPQANPNFFTLGEPEYPYLWGFGFINKYDDPGWREYSAVYGDNAYYCIGAFGYCASHVMDPLYAVFYPIYYLVGKAMTGSCGGMASVSLKFKHGDLLTQSLDPNVYFPAGFTQATQNYSASWSRSELEVAYGAASPTNLWGHIRIGQMVQISNEFLGRLLGQTCLEADWNPFCGNPADRLGEFASSPTGYVACMIDGITKGHNVTPFAVEAGDVKVYDNNAPNAVSHLTITGNSYDFPNTGYSGSGLFSVPLSIWRNGRTAPLFGTADLLIQWVAGAGDAMVTMPDGKRWGWTGDGTFVNEIPGSFSMTPQSGDFNSRAVPLLIPRSKGSPQVAINARGGDYFMHSGSGGVVATLHSADSQAGDTDLVFMSYDAQNALKSFQFAPQRQATHAVPGIGMKVGTDRSVLYRWIGLNVPAGKAVEFGAVQNQMGAEFKNFTGTPTSAYMLVQGADNTAQQASQVLYGPINVPSGAAQKSTIMNWPASTSMKSEIDLDGNGTPDQTTTLTGQVPAQCVAVAEAKLKADGTLVSLDRVVATSAAGTFDGYFYCQDPGNGSSGIKVIAPASQTPGLAPGTQLQVIGTVTTDSSGERQIVNPILLTSHTEAAPRPYVMRIASVGGTTLGSLPSGQIGVNAAEYGPNTIGLLVKTSGRVTSRSGSIVTLADGSGSVKVDLTKAGALNFEPGAYITVTGICTMKLEGLIRPRTITARNGLDLVVH